MLRIRRVRCTAAYDAADELTSEADPAGNDYAFYYDERGDLRGTRYPNGTFSWVDTNPDGWISDVYDRHGSIDGDTTSTTVPSDSSPLADFSYGYDQDGKRLSQTEISGSTSQTTKGVGSHIPFERWRRWSSWHAP